MARDMRTLRGRRVRLADLMAAGLLRDGEQLHFSIGSSTAEAEVVAPGRIRFSDGPTFQTPSPAASHATGGRSIDGWNHWRTGEGKTLDELRQTLLDQVAIEASTNADGSSAEAGELTPEGLGWLKRTRDLAIAGTGTSVRLRDLLAYWNLVRRDSVEFEHVRQALTERGLQAEPELSAATLDDLITLTSSGGGAGTLPSHTRPGGSADDDPLGRPAADLDGMSGLTIRSLWSSKRPLTSAQVHDSLDTAITKMRMHDYSQLPVLNGKTLRGAVNWASIARALRSNSDAVLSDAMFDPERCSLDRHVLEAMPVIRAHGFVVVFDNGPPCGVITLADVAEAFVQMATPFALVGDIDRRLRAALDQALDWEYLVAIIDPKEERKLPNIDRLTFGDYVAALRSEELWNQMGWWVDQHAFVEGLDEVRELRNKITHFNPDPPSEHALEQLRAMSRLVVELTTSIA